MLLEWILASACGGLIGDPAPRAGAAVSLGDPARPAPPHIPDIVIPLPAAEPKREAPAPAPVTTIPRKVAEERRYWIHLTNEPGTRALGRIRNGVAVDIIRREPIPGYRPSP